jgi:hypothetical protein
MAMDMLPIKGYHVVVRGTLQSIYSGFAGKEEPARRLLKGAAEDEESLLDEDCFFFFRCLAHSLVRKIIDAVLDPLAHGAVAP